MVEPNAYLIPFAPSDASIYEADDTEAAVRKWLAIGHTEELDFLKFRTFESTVRLYAYRHERWDARIAKFRTSNKPTYSMHIGSGSVSFPKSL